MLVTFSATENALINKIHVIQKEVRLEGNL